MKIYQSDRETKWKGHFEKEPSDMQEATFMETLKFNKNNHFGELSLKLEAQLRMCKLGPDNVF